MDQSDKIVASVLTYPLYATPIAFSSLNSDSIVLFELRHTHTDRKSVV